MIKKLLSFFGVIMVLWVLLAGQAYSQIAAGFKQGQVTYFTNNGTLYFGSNNPAVMTLTNNIRLSNATLIVDGTATVTNNGTSIVSNQTVQGENLWTPLYVTLTASTNHNYNVTNHSVIVITNAVGAGDAIVFTGFSGTGNGKRLTLINQTGSNMVFLATNANSRGDMRINLLGLDGGIGRTNTTGQGSAEFMYDVASTNWNIINLMF